MSGWACAGCLRRSHLLGLLAPRVAGALADPDARVTGLLRLDEAELLDAVGGSRRAEEEAFLERFDAGAARAAAEEAGTGVACRHGAGYPARLEALADPPAVLHVTGGFARLSALLAEPAVAVVGARRASPYAREVAHALGRRLAAAGVTVVSGLALGVDAAAHRGALGAGGAPVAVLAGGVDVAYPRTNAALYREVRRSGAVIAELPPGCEARRWSFPARNRIMAALARMTVVVEAAERSGSLITARFAAQVGRDVAAVPGQVTHDRAAGSNRLLRDGAIVVRSGDDVLEELFGAGWAAAAGIGAAADPPLEPRLRRVLDAVEAGGGVDAAGAASGLSPGGLRAALAELEVRGLLRRDPFGDYVRAAAG